MPDLDRIADKKLAAQVVDGGRLRGLVLELWQRTRMDWGFVTDRLATTFRKETWIGSHERRFVGGRIEMRPFRRTPEKSVRPASLGAA